MSKEASTVKAEKFTARKNVMMTDTFHLLKKGEKDHEKIF